MVPKPTVDSTQRRPPCALTIDRRKMSETSVIGAKNDEAARQRDRAIERGSNVAAVHQACMRDDGSDERFRRVDRVVFREAGIDLGRQSLPIPLVKRAGHGRFAGSHETNVIATRGLRLTPCLYS